MVNEPDVLRVPVNKGALFEDNDNKTPFTNKLTLPLLTLIAM